MMKITKATVKDAREILALQKLAYRSEALIYNDFEIPPLVQTLPEMERDFGRILFLKMVKGSKIIGSVRAHVENDTCFIGRLIVRPDHQGQGIGTQLMKEIEARFKHVKRYEVFTGHKSDGNMRLYNKLGYAAFKEEQPDQGPKLIFLQKISNPT